MEIFLVWMMPFALLLFGFLSLLRFILPGNVLRQVLAELIHDLIQGLFRIVFGPRRVRVVKEKRRRTRNG